MGYRPNRVWMKLDVKNDISAKERNRIASLSTFEKFAIWLDNFWKNITEKIQ